MVRAEKRARGSAVAAGRFAIEGAYGRAVPGFSGNGPVLAGELSPPSATGSAGDHDRGIDYVGQELVRLSTTPVWEQGRITPRPFVLRVFAAATPQGWTILPGGLPDRRTGDARAVSMGDGARSADVWVVSDKAVPASTLLPAAMRASGASPAWCRAAPRTICSGSAAISSAPRRRCG